MAWSVTLARSIKNFALSERLWVQHGGLRCFERYDDC